MYVLEISGSPNRDGKTARWVARWLTGLVHGFFGSGRISETLSVLRGERPVGAQAEALGRRLAQDIATRRPYRLQHPLGRSGRRLAGRLMARPRLIEGRRDTMKAVYEPLVERGALRARRPAGRRSQRA